MTTDTTTVPKLTEGQWVKDLRRTDAERLGRILVLGTVRKAWALVDWTDRQAGLIVPLETVNDLAVLTPTRGPIGEIEELHFPPPVCPYDQGDLDGDGEGWWCQTCRTTWSYNGTRGTRHCAECRNEVAAVVDVDGRPLCAGCVDDMDRERAAEAASAVEEAAEAAAEEAANAAAYAADEEVTADD